MPVLIDGDNLLHAARGVADDAQSASRAWLCRLLTSWDPQGLHHVTIFFDGVRPDSPGDGPTEAGRLTIRYSDAWTADDLIIEAIESSSASRRLVVVSSDRAVRTAARRRRARSLDSGSFITKVLNDLDRAERRAKREPPEKFRGLPPGEVDQWLKEFGIDPGPTSDEDEFGLL